MSSTRLNLLLEEQGIRVPEAGDVVILRAASGGDYAALPKDRLLCVNGFRVAYDALARRGYRVAEKAPDAAGLVLVQLTRSKAENLGLVARAMTMLPTGGQVIVDGAKTDGVESLLKSMRKVLPVGEVISKAHGKIFAATRPETLPDAMSAWARDAEIRPQEHGYSAGPGMFSPEKVDPGSALLAAHFSPAITGSVADLGAGWGWLSSQLLDRAAPVQLDLFEAELSALTAARQNITDPRARFHWADVTDLPDGAYDAIIANPPFHQGRQAEPGLGLSFIAAAQTLLAPSGGLWLVANRQLPYESALDQAFQRVERLEETPHFKVFHATRPKSGVGSKKIRRTKRSGRS